MTRNACLYAALAAAALLGSTGAACRGKEVPAPAPSGAPAVGPSTLRLYIVSDVAGALEPCGCVRDQLGGLDHAAAWISEERPRTKASAVIAAGPLFFLDPILEDDRKAQELAKARTMASSLRTLGLAAFAPGRNDFAAGPKALAELAQASGGTLVWANAAAAGAVPAAPFVVRELGGVKVGFVGVAAPADARDAPPAGPELAAGEALPAVRRAEAAARAEGARAVVVLAAVGRGEAKRIAEAIPSLAAVVVGTTGRAGDVNTKTPPLERIGDVLVIETGNHLQTLGVLDLDAQGERLVPRYDVKEVREGLGRDGAVRALLLDYYRGVNDANKAAFAGRKPRAAAAGQASYAGIERCSTCHAAARKVWDKTPHAGAYATLAEQHKEFNLDCVSCHVTGYDRPGGSTVTHVEGLRDVQCETCHGPGSLHAAAPSKANIVGKPPADVCLACHHPPHVHSFDPAAKVQAVLGPGHGRGP